MNDSLMTASPIELIMMSKKKEIKYAQIRSMMEGRDPYDVKPEYFVFKGIPVMPQPSGRFRTMDRYVRPFAARRIQKSFRRMMARDAQNQKLVDTKLQLETSLQSLPDDVINTIAHRAVCSHLY